MKNVMRNAHKLTKEIRVEYPDMTATYAQQLGICIKVLYAESKNNKAISIDVVQEELISNDVFKSLIDRIANDKFYGFNVVGEKYGYYHVENLLQVLVCRDMYPDIFASKKYELTYREEGYNEFLIKVRDFGTQTGMALFEKFADHGFRFMKEEIDCDVLYDVNNPPF